MTVAAEVQDYIVASSTAFRLGGSTAGNVFVSQVPETAPDTAVTIYETGGIGPTFSLAAIPPVVETPGLQIVSRSTSYAVARSNAESIYKTLYTPVNTSLTTSTGGTFYLTISPQQSPFDMGRDDNGRHQVICNYLVQKEVS
jgi:hypothetical protein